MTSRPSAPLKKREKEQNTMSVLTGEILRNHAQSYRTVGWDGQTMQLLRWDADLIDAAEKIVAENAQRKPSGK
jgi:hypothetical protein